MYDKHVRLVKGELDNLVRSDFEGSLFKVSKPDFLVLALLTAIGFDGVKVKKHEGVEEYVFDIYGNEVSLLKVDYFNKVVEGSSLEDLKKALYLVCAIESELTDAIEYPQELRWKAVEAAVSDSGADLGFYKKVLKNWKEYP